MELVENLHQVHINSQNSPERKHIQTISKNALNSIKIGGCGECQTSCQSACKTSCTVGNQVCVK